MKLLHTADWQIGMKAESVGEAGKRVRDERLQAGRRVIEAAKKNSVDLILVAGDLFEDNAVDRSLVQKVADILSAFEGPVYIIPGNHDPLVPGSVWDHPAWESSENLVLLKDEKPLELEICTLFPCPLHEKHSGKNPTAWIKGEVGKSINIGLAHGTVEGIQQDELDYPIPRDAAERAGLDYLALGHWHSTATYPTTDAATRMAYSGTHETSKFGERDSGNVLIVEVEAPGAKPKMTAVRTGELSWHSLSTEVREVGDLARLRQQIEKMDSPENTLIDLTLTGLLHAEEQNELSHIQEILGSRFLHGHMDASKLLPSPDDDSWVSALPPGIVREAATRLRAVAAAEHTHEAPPEIAARALMELYAIAREVVR